MGAVFLLFSQAAFPHFPTIFVMEKLIISRYNLQDIIDSEAKGPALTEKKFDFTVDYKKLKIFDEYNSKDILFPLVLSSPHSGQTFPEEFLNAVTMPADILRSNEDSFVDELILPASNTGIPLVSMNISRAFVDVNRDKIEIDPKMYYNYPSQGDVQGGIRCRVGLGVVHRINAKRENIYDGLLDYHEVQERIKYVYDVYHKKLQQLIDKTLKKFGFCFVLDCHSMPSKICSVMQESRPIDFCLGTLFDQSCPLEMSDFMKNSLENFDYKVSANCPYSGAFITFNYCQPRKKIYTMQLEMNRGLYMAEDVHKKTINFKRLVLIYALQSRPLQIFCWILKNKYVISHLVLLIIG